MAEIKKDTMAEIKKDKIEKNDRKNVSEASKNIEECKAEDEFDQILTLIGSQGKFQKLLVFGVLGPIIMIQPILTLNALFMLFEPNHWCFVPGGENYTTDDWKNLTIPQEIGADGVNSFSQCKMYASLENKTEVSCQNGWSYDKTDYDLTIPSEYNWVCDKDTYATDALTFSAIGNCAGALIFGWAADKYGRKPIFFLTVFINVFFRGVSLFVANYFQIFLAVQFIIGTAFPVMYITPCMIVAEISDKEYRGFIYAFTWVIWVVGMASLPLLAWLSRNWFLIGLITSVPGILLFAYWNILPESPRWLISVGRIKEASKIIKKIGERNGKNTKSLEDKIQSLLQSSAKRREERSESKNKGLWTLFSKKRLGLNTALVTISWSMNALLYYGITLNTSNLAGNQFLNFFILAIIEVPSGWLGGFLVNRTGRRWTQVGFFALSIIAFSISALSVIYPTLSWLTIVSIICAKFCITITFLVVYLQGAEIFPTELRSTGSGFASTTASAVGIVGPYLIFLGKLNATLPYIAMICLSLVGLIASGFLPETLHRNLPESVSDANKIGKGIKFWSYLPHKAESNQNDSHNKNNDSDRKL